MLFDLVDLKSKYDMKITGILHVGAHTGEEAPKYAECGIQNVVWVEANPLLIAPLTQFVEPYGHEVIQALVADEEGKEIEFNVSNNGQSSSILDLGLHEFYVHDVWYTGTQKHISTTIDALGKQHGFLHAGFNFLNMDLQGAELLALKGATEYIKDADYIYTEVNSGYVYKECALIPELDAFLSDFHRVETSMTPHEWGDALYVRVR